MNREEAIKFFELQTQDEQALIDGINLNPDDFVFGAEGPEQYINDCQNNIDAYNTAITALRGPHPDPITGLVPCGCGGKAHIINSSGYSRRLYVECDRCAIMLGVEATGDGALQGIYRYDDQIIKDWNHAMGMLEVEE